MATLDTVLATIKTLNATTDALNARLHPPSGNWTVEQPLSVNNGTVLYGQTIHNWGETGVVARLAGLGCKRYHAGFAWGPGRVDTFDIPGMYINEAVSLGVKPSLSLLDYQYSTGSALAATATNLAATWRGRCDQWAVGNEPWNGTVSPQQYLAHLKVIYAALKAGNPNCIVMAPTTTGNDFTWARQFIALNPWPWLDAWAWHTYYASPEESYAWNLNTVPQMVAAAAGKQVPMYIEEVGWALSATDQVGSGAVGFTEATRQNYASRYLFLAAGTQSLRALTIYAAKDEGQPQWGACDANWIEYPYASCLRDAAVHVHASVSSAVYNRGSSWFVRMNTPTGQRLALWNPGGTVSEKVYVNLPTSGAITVQTIGGQSTAQAASIGAHQLSFAAGKRAVVLSAPGATFPEFS